VNIDLTEAARVAGLVLANELGHTHQEAFRTPAPNTPRITTAVLEAALPIIERRLRQQIADDLRAVADECYPGDLFPRPDGEDCATIRGAAVQITAMQGVVDAARDVRRQHGHLGSRAVTITSPLYAALDALDGTDG
jgi:hypothetical protein